MQNKTVKLTYPMKSKQTTFTSTFVNNVSMVTSSDPDAWQLIFALEKLNGLPLTVYSLFGPPILIDEGVLIKKEDDGSIMKVELVDVENGESIVTVEVVEVDVEDEEFIVTVDLIDVEDNRYIVTD